MPREKLLSTLYELESFFKILSQNEHKQIAKMQNISQNELMQITKIQNLSLNELEQIAKKRDIKKIQEYVKRRIINVSFKNRANHC